MNQYHYLTRSHVLQESSFEDSEYYIVFLVDAKHLDYTNSQTFLKTFTKHPSTGNKECNVGHAWIYLKGIEEDNNAIVIEGGHSGELGIAKLRYVDGISMLAQKDNSNPISYLWESLDDGFFQQGCGGHIPTCAAKINLTKEQFWAIYTFINPRNYPYEKYSLTQRQCASLIVQIAALIDIQIEADITLKIYPHVYFSNQKIRLWSDPEFSEITFSTPDMIEKNLINLILQGKAEPALSWYLSKKRQKPESIFRKVINFPKRYYRHLSIN